MKDLSDLLQEYDRLCVVSFNHSATRDCKLVRMNEKGKGIIDSTMKELYSSGSTNIGSGIRIGLKVLTERRQRNKVSSLLVLSDG